VDISPPSLSPPSDDDEWQPGLWEFMAIIGIVAAYWSGWLDALWPF